MIGVATTLRRAASATTSRAPLRFHVADWAAASTERSDKQDWIAWLKGETTRPQSPAPALPLSLRRRITPIGQMAFRTALALGPSTPARFIFCSRHGEFRRTTSLLRTLAHREEPVASEFSLAVHNALAGILSIEWQNNAGHTAIAAGADSFGFGLVEAAACLKTRPAEPILLVYSDEALLEEYAELREGEETAMAVALLLKAAQGSGDVALSFARRARGTPARRATEPALDFLRFLVSDEAESTSPGGAVEWRWHRDAA